MPRQVPVCLAGPRPSWVLPADNQQVRLFVSLVPPAVVLDALPSVPAEARAVRLEQVHLTLAFLGEVTDPSPLMPALATTRTLAAPRLALFGSGRFGNAVWLGLSGDLDQLETLARTVQDSVRACGFALERRPWRPHLTIARGRPWPLLRDYAGPAASWEEVRLVRSHLDQHAARHETVDAWRLTACDEDGPAGTLRE
jgi:2'-5' RNA ligase